MEGGKGPGVGVADTDPVGKKRGREILQMYGKRWVRAWFGQKVRAEPTHSKQTVCTKGSFRLNDSI
jgi:hypothetical protein